MGKRTDLKFYKVQKRGGSGIKTAKITDKTGKIVSGYIVDAEDKESNIIMTSIKGQIIRISLTDISVLSRATQGVKVMKPKTGDSISATTIL